MSYPQDNSDWATAFPSKFRNVLNCLAVYYEALTDTVYFEP